MLNIAPYILGLITTLIHVIKIIRAKIGHPILIFNKEFICILLFEFILILYNIFIEAHASPLSGF